MNYGYEFECKLVASLINDTQFLTQIGDILNPQVLSSPGGRWIATTAVNYFKEFKQAPSLLVFKTEIEKIDPSLKLLKEEAVSFLRDVCSHAHALDLDYVKEQSINYFKNEEIKAAILQSVDLLRTNDYDKIKSVLDHALKLGISRELGHDYKEDFEFRYAEEIRNPVTTGWDVIDDITQGGVGAGEVGVVIACPNVGKTWVMCAIGAAAVKAGLTVVHYTLELNKYYVAKRYDSILSGIAGVNLSLHKDQVERMVNELPGNLIVEEYPTKSATVLTLEAHLDRCISLGKRPDLVIVDYASLVKGPNKDRRDLEILDVYENLRGLAGKYKCPVWTAGQAHREASTKDIVEEGDIAEAYSIMFISDFVMTLARKPEDSLAGTGRFNVIKNRHGPRNMVFPARFNGANGRVDIYLSNTREAVSARKDMEAGGELRRKDLERKYFDKYLEYTGSGEYKND